MSSSSQVDAVKRKLVGSLNKQAVDHAVEAYGYDREKVEEVLVLCGGSQHEMSQRWNAFRRTPEQVMKDAASHDNFELDEFIAYVRDQKQQEKASVRPKRRQRRKRGRRR